jgi:hypothetical protein
MRYLHLLRFLFVVALLIVTWHHAHWSVALPLTLLALFNEALTWWMRTVVRNLAALSLRHNP